MSVSMLTARHTLVSAVYVGFSPCIRCDVAPLSHLPADKTRHVIQVTDLRPRRR